MRKRPSPVRVTALLFEGDTDAELKAIAERNNGVVRPSRRRKIAFGWYGGKYSHLDWLLPLLPNCHHYCEPFGGSAAVLLNRQWSGNASIRKSSRSFRALA